MVKVLTIAGFDPSGGAGIIADIKTFCAIGVYPAGVVTCIAVQNEDNYIKSEPVDHEIVSDQIEAALEGGGVRAVKIGMLYSKENVKAVSHALSHHTPDNVVLDPLITSSTGGALTDYDISFLRNELLPHIDIVTPNLKEAVKLSGHSIVKPDDLKEAALEITSYGCESVVITGYTDEKHSIDMLYDGEDFIEYKEKLLEMPDLHGTGCTFSAAVAALLAKGNSVKEAVKEAKEYTYNAIKYAVKLDGGRYALNHFFMQG